MQTVQSIVASHTGASHSRISRDETRSRKRTVMQPSQPGRGCERQYRAKPDTAIRERYKALVSLSPRRTVARRQSLTARTLLHNASMDSAVEDSLVSMLCDDVLLRVFDALVPAQSFIVPVFNGM